jgi:hypothetical protein
MAAVEADRVVVALEAKIGDYQAKVSGAAKTFDASMSQIEKSATRAEVATRTGLTRIGESSRGAGASQLILQSIVRRTSDQFAAGAPLATIFAEHVAGLAEAGALAGGSLGKLGAFLAGPWGLILSGAVTVASVLGSKLLEGGAAAKKQKDELQRLTEALQEYQRTSGEAVSNDYVRIRLMDELTARTAAQTVKIRENIKAQLAQAEANRSGQQCQPGRHHWREALQTSWRTSTSPDLGAAGAGRQGCSGSPPQRECRAQATGSSPIRSGIPPGPTKSPRAPPRSKRRRTAMRSR